MKLLVKNGYTFITGMFWQIPDEGKRNINLTRLSKDTKHNIFCQIKTLNQTYGFCHKNDLHGIKKVASMGKFIIEISKLSTAHTNSIICYKFKNSGELDEGHILQNDLYGYIVLLNGTICPDEGEYVSEFSAIRESIINKAKRHEIETLYLPSEVASKFFNVFELLHDASMNDETLTHLFEHFTPQQIHELEAFIWANFGRQNKYSNLFNVTLQLGLLREFIDEDLFINKVKDTRELNLKYLIPNIYTLAFTSDEVYWHSTKFKEIYNKSLVTSIFNYTSFKYKIMCLFLFIVIAGYIGYSFWGMKDPLMVHKPIVKPKQATPYAMLPMELIKHCILNNDTYFKELGNLTLMSVKCNSLGTTLVFNSDTDTTITTVSNLLGAKNNIVLNGRVVTLTQIYQSKSVVTSSKTPVINKTQILNKLEQSAIDYKLRLTIKSSSNIVTNQITKFTLNSQLSPEFLLNHGVLNDVKLSDISMNFDKSSGFYHWVLQGEF